MSETQGRPAATRRAGRRYQKGGPPCVAAHTHT